MKTHPLDSDQISLPPREATDDSKAPTGLIIQSYHGNYAG